jgi:type IV pilus assembly protein PilC
VANFSYKAVDEQGTVVSATVEYDTQEEVLNYIKSKKLMPIEVKQVNAMTMDLADVKLFKPKIKTKDLAIFCRQFAVIIEAGIAIGTALDILRRQIENPSLKKRIQDVYDGVQKGATLSEAMSQYSEFPVLMISMVEVGEASGNLDQSLKQLANQYDKDLATERKIKGAMTYPAIVATLMVAVIIVVVVFVVPSYTGMFKEMGAELPGVTLALMAFSDFMVHKWYIVVGFIIALIVGFKAFVNNQKGRYAWDSLLLKLPAVGQLITKINTARFSRTMSTLLSAGVPILQGLEIIYKIINNTVVKTAIENAIVEVKQGTSLADPIEESGLFPYMLSSMLRIGEESGSLDSIMNKTADFYDAEVDVGVEQLTTFIEPAITIVIAGCMGFMMLAILMPTFSLATQM